MSKIWFVEVDNSGYTIPFLVVENSREEVYLRIKKTIEKNKIGNGYAKVKNVAPISGALYDDQVYRPDPENVINFAEA